MKFFIGIIMIVIGFFLVTKNDFWLSFIGRNEWAESKMQTMGGSRMFYKLIGLGIIIIGFLLITGLYDGFMRALVSPLISSQPGF